MRVRILSSRGGYPVGAIVSPSVEEANDWIADGDAELVKDGVDLETAMKPKAKGR